LIPVIVFFQEVYMDPLIYKALNRARIALSPGDKTFVVVNETSLLYHTGDRGLFPVLKLLDERAAFLENAVVGDKIVGRAATLLFLYAKVKAVYAAYISDEAVGILEDNNCIVTWRVTVPCIVERDLGSRYRLDVYLEGVSDPAEAEKKIREFLASQK
jgi:hypothetical protein